MPCEGCGKLIVEAAVELLGDCRNAPLRVADVGTGSGCLAVGARARVPAGPGDRDRHLAGRAGGWPAGTATARFREPPMGSRPTAGTRRPATAASTLIRYAGQQIGRGPALDDPVANLRQPARAGNVLQRGGQPARCGCVELPLRLPAQQRPFFGAALRDPLLATLRDHDPLREPRQPDRGAARRHARGLPAARRSDANGRAGLREIDQRLATLERAVIPAAEPAE